MGGKCGPILGCVVLVVLAGMLLANPLASPNFSKAADTLETIALIMGGVGIVGLVLLLGTGANIQIGGSRNRIGDDHTTVNVNERAPSGAVRRYTDYED